MIIDPISDMLTRIRNASMAHKPEVTMPFSKAKFAIAAILKQEGYLGKVETVDDKFKQLKVTLKYQDKQPVIRKISRVSKPGCRIYVKKDNLPVVLNNYGLAIISTPQGIMSNKEAKRRGVGGEVICEIY